MKAPKTYSFERLLCFVMLSIFTLLCSPFSNAQNFAQKPLSSPTGGLDELMAVDLDGDTDDDILGIGYNEVYWIENLASGKMGPKQIISVDIDEGEAIHAEDIDGDGLNDILSASNNDNKIAWYKNLGDGEFGPQIVLGTFQISPRDVVGVDMDNDGDNDVLACSYTDNEIAWYQNNGSGNFGISPIISVALDSPTAAEAIDLDNDGDMDIVAVSQTANELAWFENLGGMSYGPKNIISSAIGYQKRFRLTDMDLDGNLDLLLYSNNLAGWMKNLGGGNFAPYDTLQQSSNLGSCFAIDLDGDLDLDFMSGSSNGTIFKENQGSGNFGPEVQLAIYFPNQVIAADLTLDGQPEIISGTIFSDIVMYENMGGLTFYQKGITYATVEPEWVELADMDGDGDSDLITSNEDQVSIFENLGLGEFTKGRKLDQASISRSVSAGDIDGDGDLDVVTTSTGGNWVGWIENLGNGNFGTVTVLNSSVSQCDRAIASDLDLDGDVDIFFRYFSCLFSCSKIAWLENLGNGTFANKVEIVQTNPPTNEMTLADLNGDQLPDFVTVSGLDVTFYENLGGGAFAPAVAIASDPGTPETVNVADIDSDGDLDIITAANDGFWYENLGNGNFGPGTMFAQGIAGNPQSILGADMNADNQLDIVVGCTGVDQLYWAENSGGGVFDTVHVIPGDFVLIKNLDAEDLDQDGDADLIVASFVDDQISYIENGIYDRNQLRGKLYYDIDSSGTADPGEVGITWVQMNTNPQNAYSYTDPFGDYRVTLNATPGDTFLIYPSAVPHWSVHTLPAQYSVPIDSNFVFVDSLDFGFLPDDTITNDLNIDLVPGVPRCNQSSKYWIHVQNQGTTQPHTLVQLTLNDSVNFLSSNHPTDSIVGQNIYWSYNQINFFESKSIELEVLMPGVTMLGDTLISDLNVSVNSSGAIVYSQYDSVHQELICAYDPNDKQAMPAGIGPEGFIRPDTDHIEYLIRFQNTGNDTAFNITIKDIIDPNLDLQSLTPLASSHFMELSVDYLGEVSFKFPDIMLPDSSTDFLGSQGYIKYRIDLVDSLPIGTTIMNTARIYFDANPPIITNTALNTLGCADSIDIWLMNEQDSILCEGGTLVQIGLSRPGGILTGPGISGNLLDTDIAGQGNHIVYYDLDEGNGCVYQTSINISIVDCLSLPDEELIYIKVYPNPFSNSIIIDHTFSEPVEVKIEDINGRVVANYQAVESGTILSVNNFTSGIYFIQIEHADGIIKRKMIHE